MSRFWLESCFKKLPEFLIQPFNPLIQTNPDRFSPAVFPRNKKKNLPMSQLTEEAQRLKRAAWRAASKRYYARKIARQQANLQRVGPAVHATDSRRGGFMEERRKRLISDLPEESQILRREVWRAASRRYYGRKTARHQTDGMQYGHRMENLNPAGATQGPNGDGPLVISGGIMCSWFRFRKCSGLLDAGRASFLLYVLRYKLKWS